MIGLVMLGALGLLAGSLTRDDPRTRARWDSRFDREDRGERSASVLVEGGVP